jgi:hypothetical protein
MNLWNSCLNGQSSLVQEVKVRFNALVDIIGYKGRVNVDKDGNSKIVADGELYSLIFEHLDCFCYFVCRLL